MIEWQNESSLFTIRIQGKQWYWVYKYDPNTAQAVMSTPKNVGHNKWRVVSGQESYNADTYYQAIHLAAHLEFQDSYSKFTTKIDTHKKNLTTLNLSNEKIVVPTVWSDNLNAQNTNYPYSDNEVMRLLAEASGINLSPSKFVTWKSPVTDAVVDFDIVSLPDSDLTSNVLTYRELIDNTPKTVKKSYAQINNRVNMTIHPVYFTAQKEFGVNMFATFFADTSKQYFNAYYDFLQLDETSDVDSNNRHYLTTQPFRLLKGVLNQHVVDILQNSKFSTEKLTKLLFLNTKYSQSGEMMKDKELLPETLWGFRQKKYKRMKKFKFKPEVIYDPVTFKIIGQRALPTSPTIDIAGLELQRRDTATTGRFEGPDVTLKNKDKTVEDIFNYRISARINRHRSELVPVTLARRLLRTKRTLVLPAHVNLTVITNSYDVVHSWFVPGLGLKMDCVPGRSTHHTFYIDNIGFYYGQCAEICGRYHHHMPIRLCALPFEHFVVWWQAKGTARMNRTTEINNNRFLQQKFNNPVTREKLIYRMN